MLFEMFLATCLSLQMGSSYVACTQGSTLTAFVWYGGCIELRMQVAASTVCLQSTTLTHHFSSDLCPLISNNLKSNSLCSTLAKLDIMQSV